MTETWALAALWLGLALFAGLLALWLRIVTAMSEVMVGIAAGAVLGAAFLGVDHGWVRFLAGAGAIVLVFLAGTELEPAVFRRKWKEATAVGFASFLAPFVICAAAAYWLLGWSFTASLLAGIAMSTTSVAVVYAVIMEFRFNATDYGKTLLAACFITDLGTVVLLGLIFAPFTLKTLAFVGALAVAALALPWVTPWLFRRFAGRVSEFETKFVLICLFALGALATWADSEAVLPAFILGVLLAGTVGRNHALVQRLRALCFGLLTPFFFIRAGSLVSLPALAAAPVAFLVMLLTKVAAKTAGVYPVTRAFGAPRSEAVYSSLLMSTGLTFGTIAALYGFEHSIVDETQYSVLVAAVIASGVVPTLIANAWFLPRHQMPASEPKH
jgi:glutathione-regulated potassium-efflux system ancillary protein KefC